MLLSGGLDSAVLAADEAQTHTVHPVYVAAGLAWEQGELAIVERLLVVAPGDAKEIRDRGLLLAHLGQSGAAVQDLECYLALAPSAPDVDSVRGRLAWIRRRTGQPR